MILYITDEESKTLAQDTDIAMLASGQQLLEGEHFSLKRI